MRSARRKPLPYLFLIAFVVVLGVSSRRWPHLQQWLGEYPGDALWGLMVFLGWGLLLRGWETAKLAILAVASCYFVEFAQLYHAPWIDAIRSTTLGHLALGAGFQWLDLLAYTVGIAVGVICETLLSQSLRVSALGERGERM